MIKHNRIETVIVLLAACLLTVAICTVVSIRADDNGKENARAAPVEVTRIDAPAEPLAKIAEPETQATPEPEAQIFTVTAYCACKKCCGYWATVRPLDKNGNPIVYTATGAIATEGRTIAVDPNVIPYGTRVMIDGNVYVAEDCGGGIKGNVIDIYFADHEEAVKWGKQNKEVIILDA